MLTTAALPASPTLDCANERAIETLYQKTGRAALAKLTRLVGRRDVAEEILQDVFLKLWERRPRFDDERQAYLWIYKACHNAGIDYLRSPRGRERIADPDEAIQAPDAIERVAQRQLVCKALAAFDPRDVAIYAYTVVDGMTQEEIADLLGLSRRTVNRVLARLEEGVKHAKRF